MTDRNSKAKRTQKANEARRLSQDEFIRRCVEKHGNAYDYSLVEFKGTQSKITIICNKCKQKSEQYATNHVRGARCFNCYGKKRYNKDSFADKANTIHSNKYSYEKVKYKNNRAKVEIVCLQHGSFHQAPTDHLQGKGCPDCAKYLRVKKSTMSFSLFEKRCRKEHRNKYDYDAESYTKTDNLVRIRCPKHGWFEQNAKAHLHGKGCKQCGYESGGYNRTRFELVCNKNNKGNGFFYLIKCKKGKEVFYKAGITSRQIKERYATKFQMPYDFELIYWIEDKPAYIFNLENRIHALLKEHHYTPQIEFKGSVYECFTTIKPVEKLLKELSTTEQLQLLA